ncbi:hypothetical protein F7R25_03935 [Burkholderia stagnalis]|uniref:Uncharacterized protein n=1 Tax=Burkholderia stagnalis TaxID=1503054 RepID=A0A6L3N2Z4_9BURK|nr:hypothetical protein [Burkholderia stagnalis]KAB0640655.1 hypothetical protein F7R25_03935 [Burkholderia stagnalis]VWB06072.1 hypothetical protein BST28156_00100 [Burkholderia stagnalis]
MTYTDKANEQRTVPDNAKALIAFIIFAFFALVITTALKLLVMAGGWVRHELTTFPITDKNRIVSEARYCDGINIEMLVDGKDKHIVVITPHFQRTIEDSVSTLIGHFDKATLKNVDSICTLTITNKKGQL